MAPVKKFDITGPYKLEAFGDSHYVILRKTELESEESKKEGLFYIKKVDPRNTAFTWSPTPRKLADGIEELARITTYHDYAAAVFFKPSMAEVLAQIPKEYLDKTIAFETFPADGGSVQGGFSNDGSKHKAETVLYKEKIQVGEPSTKPKGELHVLFIDDEEKEKIPSVSEQKEIAKDILRAIEEMRENETQVTCWSNLQLAFAELLKANMSSRGKNELSQLIKQVGDMLETDKIGLFKAAQVLEDFADAIAGMNKGYLKVDQFNWLSQDSSEWAKETDNLAKIIMEKLGKKFAEGKIEHHSALAVGWQVKPFIRSDSEDQLMFNDTMHPILAANVKWHKDMRRR